MFYLAGAIILALYLGPALSSGWAGWEQQLRSAAPFMFPAGKGVLVALLLGGAWLYRRVWNRRHKKIFYCPPSGDCRRLQLPGPRRSMPSRLLIVLAAALLGLALLYGLTGYRTSELLEIVSWMAHSEGP